MKQSIKWIICLIVAVIMALPIVFMLIEASKVDVELWQRMLEYRVPKLMGNLLLLVLTVTFFSIIVGGGLAFLVERTNLPGRSWFRPLLISPLIIPCYIIAICYINFFGLRGVGEKLFHFFGMEFSLPNLYGFWGAAFMLTLGVYPYVYTIVGTSLNKLDPTFSEVAQSLGVGRLRRMTHVAIPLLIPALSAGGLLSALYVLSDFGVVSLLRYPTFVSAIFDQISGRYDYSAATALSTFLLIMTILIFVFQGKLTSQRQYVSSKNKTYNRELVPLGMWTVPAVFIALTTLILGLFLPLGVLIYWFVQSFQVSSELSIWTISWSEMLASGRNSLTISTIVATLGVLAAIPLASLSIRQSKKPLAKGLSWVSQSGIALPGVLVALGISLLFRQIAPQWNFSIFALILALLVHFFAQGLQMTQAGFMQISVRLEEAAKLLGKSSLQTFNSVTGPMLRPALLTAWTLIFLSSMRELPASLLLRPAGFDPLTVKVWLSASEGFYEQAAGPALLLICLSLPMVIIINYYRDHSRV